MPFSLCDRRWSRREDHREPRSIKLFVCCVYFLIPWIMPSRHSKNAGDRGFHTHKETHTNDFGTQRARLSTDSQLPFGYCPLSLIPIKEAVLSPSGRLYDREAILDYLLQKTQEIKKHQIAYEKQQQLYAKEVDSECLFSYLLVHSFSNLCLAYSYSFLKFTAARGTY